MDPQICFFNADYGLSVYPGGLHTGHVQHAFVAMTSLGWRLIPYVELFGWEEQSS